MGQKLIQNKIFGIGLPKTATISLSQLMSALGFHSRHFIEKHICQTFEIFLELCEPYDFIIDVPVSIWYQRIPEQSKNCKFINTYRSLDSWLFSCQTHFAKSSTDLGWRKELFNGHTKYDEKAFIETYHNHRKNVEKFSLTNPTLQLNICEHPSEENINKLCNFLGISVPENIKMPHANAK